MTGPLPINGANPYTLAYQKHQFDAHNDTVSLYAANQETVLDALESPPAAGIAAEASPSILFLENTDPPVGTIGNPGVPNPAIGL